MYLIYDKEMFSIMHELSKLKKYLVGGLFVVRTDHNSLRYFLEQRDLNEKQQKWVSKVKEYDFYIEYVKGKKNIFVDASSRRPVSFSMTKILAYWNSILLVEYSKKTFPCEIMEGNIQDDRYRVVDDIIYYKYMIYLFPNSTLKDNILREVL
jgi:hypothetical protein